MLRMQQKAGSGSRLSSGIEAEPLMRLARSRDPTDREQLLARLVAICETHSGALAPRAAAEVEAVFLALVRDAERDIRRRLAERIADVDWAPPRSRARFQKRSGTPGSTSPPFIAWWRCTAGTT